jgi:DNA-binding protein HU-beta
MEKTMNKADFVNHIAEQHQCTKTEAEKTIDIFTSSVIDAIGQGNEISLIGFGNFSISKVAARTGRNPATGKAVEISARNQPKFKDGQKLKDACNRK